MKKIIFLILFILSFSSFAEKVVVHVPGMVCQMCVHGMKKSFEANVGNAEKDILVDLDLKTVSINLIKKMTEDEIKERVKDAGYNVTKIVWSDSHKDD